MRDVAYHEVLPEDKLLPLVKCFWLSVNRSGSEQTFATLPDGCLELVVSVLNGRLNYVKIYGVLGEAYENIVMPAGELKYGVRLKPLGREYYLDKILSLDRFAVFTQNLLAGQPGDLRRFAGQVAADICEVVDFNAIDHRKRVLFDLLEKYAGAIEVERIARESFWSSRQINRYIRHLLGMSLKSYGNILKCYAAYSSIRNGNLNPGTGYYDQSHFIREIRKHTGTTPKMLYKNNDNRYLQFNTPDKNDATE